MIHRAVRGLVARGFEALLLLLALAGAGCNGILGIHVLDDDVTDGAAAPSADGGDASVGQGAPGDSGRPDVGYGGSSGPDVGPPDVGPDGRGTGDAAPDVAPPRAQLGAGQSSLDLGTVTVGQSVSGAKIQITNDGNAATAALTTQLTGSGFTIANDGCVGTALPPGLSCAIAIDAITTAAGSLSGAITVTDTASDKVTVMLTATVVAAGALSVTPSSQIFPSVPVGTAGAPITFTVTNTGGAATGPLSVSLAGTNASDYLLVDGCTSKTLAPTGTCSLTIRLAPATAGPKTASLAVTATPGGTGTASLTGDVLAPASLTVSPSTYPFPTVVLHDKGTLTTETFVVSNGGDVPSSALTTGLTFGVGTASTEFAITADTCNGKTLAGMLTCDVTVTFQPATFGSKSATLEIPGAALSATMTGTAEDELQLSITKTGSGTGTVTDSSGVINCGATCSGQFPRTTENPTVSLTATGTGGSTFAGWTGGGCTGAANPCVVTLSAATTVSAAFNSPTVALTVNFLGLGSQAPSIASSPPGISCTKPCTATASFPSGTAVTLTVTQAANAIDAWTGGGCSKGATCKLTLAGPTTVSVGTTNENVVFVTSQIHNGNFGGLAGANAFCNSVAAAGALPGTFVAFLRTSTATPYAPLGPARGWIRPDGLPFTDTVSGLQNDMVMWYPPDLDETGVVNLAGYFAGGQPANGAQGTCSDWTSGSTSQIAIGGGGGEGDQLVGFISQNCSQEQSLLCFGTDFATPVSVTAPAGPARNVFVSSSSFPTISGLAGADSICQMESSAAGFTDSQDFLAALSTESASAQSRFNMNGPNWIRTDGVVLAASTADFMAGKLLAPPSTGASGAATSVDFWIGSSGGLTGTAASTGNEDCDDWTSDRASVTGVFGASTLVSPIAFTQYGGFPTSCSQNDVTPFAVLCVEN